SRYLPSSGLKIDASPSFTSNQSLPKASMMLGLCVMRKVFLPFSGISASILRRAAARRLFSSGDTTRPPSVRSVVFSMFLNPASTGVFKGPFEIVRKALVGGTSAPTESALASRVGRGSVGRAAGVDDDQGVGAARFYVRSRSR